MSRFCSTSHKHIMSFSPRLLLLFCVLALALAGPASDRGEEELDEYYDHVNDRNIWDYYGTGGRDGDENDDVEDRNIFEDYGEYDDEDEDAEDRNIWDYYGNNGENGDEDEDEDVYDDDVYNR